LTHQDQAEDIALAASGDYDIVLGGHDHGVDISAVSKVGGGVRKIDNPKEVYNLNQGEETFIIKSGQDAEYATIVDLKWPAGTTSRNPTVTQQLIRVK
jgi:2',3'-cyclic-nucleotide 2'-phosphodiesterase (5'-nucleotidase family)